MFSVRTSNYQGNTMLNMCDDGLLGKYITENNQTMHISGEYYGGEIVSRETATRLLQESSIINMVGSETVSLAVEIGVGARDGARIISGVPFLIVFKM